MLSQRLKPKTLRRALFTAILQLVISAAEYSLTAQACVRIGTQLQHKSNKYVPGKKFRIELVARKNAATSGRATKPN